MVRDKASRLKVGQAGPLVKSTMGATATIALTADFASVTSCSTVVGLSVVVEVVKASVEVMVVLVVFVKTGRNFTWRSIAEFAGKKNKTPSNAHVAKKKLSRSIYEPRKLLIGMKH